MEEKRSRRSVIIILLVLNLMFSIAVLTTEIVKSIAEAKLHEQYTLYIGTNDKDTDRQEIPFDECRAIVENTCLQYVSGCTVTEANGVWTDDAGNAVRENTIVCCINGATESDINSIVDRLLIELNQSSIMVEHQNLSYTYQTHQ